MSQSGSKSPCRRLCCAAFGALLGWSVPATGAELPGAALTVRRGDLAPDCPDDQTLATAVRSQLKGEGEQKEGLLLDVAMDSTGSSYTAVIRVSGRKNGVRTLRVDGPNCDGLADAVTVTLALLLDKDLFLEEPPPPPEAPLPSQPPPRPEPSPSSVSAWVGLGGAATSGFPEGLSGAATLDLGLELDRFTFAIEGFWTPSREVDFPPGTVRVGLVGGGVRGCVRAVGERKAVHLMGCALFDLALLQGKGRGFTEDRTQRRPWLGAGGSAEVGGPIGDWLGWAATGAVVAPLQRETFSVDGLGKAYDPDLVAVLLGAQLRVRFW